MVRAKSGREPVREPDARPTSRAKWEYFEPIGFGAIVLLLTVVTLLAAPRSIQAGDAGEFATVMLEGGIPHPSGYPWMRLLGLPARLFRWLGLPPAMAAAVPCGLAGVAAFAALFRLLCRLGAPATGIFAVGLVGTSSVAITHLADSEVWGPHLLFCALFTRLALGGERRSPIVLGITLGLAVSHHLSAVLLAPLAVGAAWPERPIRETGPGPLLWNGALGLLGSALGLLPYASLAIGSGGAWRWGDPRSVSGLVHHVSRADYGVVALSLHTDQVSSLDVVRRALASLAEALTAGALPWSGAMLALAAILALAARRPESTPAPAWIGLWASLGSTSLLFPALQNIDPHRPFGSWILERFDLLPLMLWSIPLALALSRLTRLELRGGVRRLLVAASVLLVALQLLRTFAGGLPAQERGVERYAVDVLRTPAPGASPRPALVFGTDDHRTFPALYAAEVLKEGQGAAVYVDASLLAMPWYRAHVRARWPGLPDVDKPLRLMGAIWADSELRDTPIYITHPFSRPAARDLQLVPEGVLWRVIPPGADPRAFDPGVVVDRHLAALARYDTRATDFAGRTTPLRHPWSLDLWAAYEDRSAVLVLMLRGRGDEARATRVEAAFEDAFGVPLEPGAAVAAPPHAGP